MEVSSTSSRRAGACTQITLTQPMVWLTSSVHFRALALLRMLQTLDCTAARKRHCLCFVHWSLLGEGEPSLDIWEAGPPCCASAFPPAPKAVELGRCLPCPIQPAQRELVQAPGLLSTLGAVFSPPVCDILLSQGTLTSLLLRSTYLNMTVGNLSPYSGRELLLKGKFCVWDLKASTRGSARTNLFQRYLSCPLLSTDICLLWGKQYKVHCFTLFFL